ncbi:alkylation response protein AidB-like acyl-CoA dehydrogenase [Streptomyces sp. SAI-135]|jgi:alkylation response protein AidB-like acyl-CoA dehydrogenase|uniref:acyl-CoA dehydrogenase family protein n=2 Tax=Streptomyces TaxID=1883 RepID=UPI0024752BFB|nr:MULTISPECIES: acyl-CoA dehydrogenase family protein [unclassified Streptomyces]MDH6523091.1 alkylation response protein AidB-like acyl-CoA dehydrogenase [Streptomyces sp. SAI-090]MDH6573974.1 alkylation response protein AidB-like acyl-CoA dehydrogenase [Streptomyces sp. SAI-117]MDH6613295.1 alkylation response protein AidB-like acyl-CoA dehydrogenase [Streptomyces sp. SAI-135]MDH6554702.1 alkylation response protein AidB-like acyl-CoA dehydrogenase [Streptomyces sp. SAI-041]MDH6581289.1 alk
MTETAGSVQEATEALIAKARAAVPVLAAHADATAEQGRLAPESLEALREAGLFALGTPVEFGGTDVDLVTLVRVLSELGRACPSSAWLVSISTGTKAHFSGGYPEKVLAEVYSHPDVRWCGGSTPGQAVAVPGGAEVTGRWAYASGAEDAHWAFLAVVSVGDDGVPHVRGALVPMSELAVDRTWRVAGLQGTGSHTVVADGVFVPAERLLDFPLGPDGAPDLTQGRPLEIASQTVSVTATLAGAALGALDVVKAVIQTRKPPMTQYNSLAESASARHVFAEAEHMVNSGYDRLISLAGRITEQLPGDDVTALQRSSMRMEVVSILQQFLRAVDLLLDLHGSSAFALDNPLQRFWRDLNVGARHAQLSTYLTTENYGLLVTGAGGPVQVG